MINTRPISKKSSGYLTENIFINQLLKFMTRVEFTNKWIVYGDFFNWQTKRAKLLSAL